MGDRCNIGCRMANFLRLVLLFIFCLFSFSVSAEAPVTQYSGYVSTSCANTGWVTDVNSAGSAAVVCRNIVFATSQPTNCVFAFMTGLVASANCTNSSGASALYGSVVTVNTRQFCTVANVVASGGTCPPPVCAAGQVLVGGVCVNDCSVKKGTVLNSGLYDMGLSPTANFPMITCSGGCSVEFSGYAPARVDRQVPPHYYAKGAQSFSGWSCSPGETTTPGTSVPPDPPTPVCAPGTCPGTVNGQSVCVPCADAGLSQTTTSAKTNSSTNSAGQTTTTTTSTQTTTSPDGSSVTSNSSTSTGTQSAGATGDGTKTTDSKKQDTPSFCAENPNSPLCKDKEKSKSSGGGDCSSPPVSEGDAISSAILFQAWKTRCAIDYQADSSSGLGQSVIAGSDPLAGGFPTVANGTTKDLSSDFNTAINTRLLSASCPSALSFSVLNSSFSVNLSGFCNSLSIAGNIIVALSLLAAVRIVGLA